LIFMMGDEAMFAALPFYAYEQAVSAFCRVVAATGLSSTRT